MHVLAGLRIIITMVLETEIVELKSFDVYRDGGSISASFRGADGIEYCLFFQVRRPPGKPRRYGAPLLKWFSPYEYRSPVTGDISPMWREEREPIDWREAQKVLNDLARFVEGPEQIFDDMVRAAAEGVGGA